ncbi:tail protein [Staphylococcus phage PG-2021_76]
MKTVEDAKKLVTKFINNIAVFDELTTSIIEQRDAELIEYTSEYVYERVSGVRPYEGVIERIEVFNIDFEDIQNNISNIDMVVSFRKKIYLVDKDKNVGDTIVTLNIKLQLENDNWIIDNYEQEQDVLYADYFQYEEDEEELPTSITIARYLIDNYNSFTNIKYMFKGKPSENPFETDKDVYIDSFNMLYWLYRREGIELDYPLTVDSLLISSKFIEVFKKGHKYEFNVDKLSRGDILFFGKSDVSIGIYTGENTFISVRGKFPKDNKGLDLFKLDEYWKEFNGRVLRYGGDI